ncbi:MAG: lamin tail domain-containing protein [Polyangiales bacterium]
MIRASFAFAFTLGLLACSESRSVPGDDVPSAPVDAVTPPDAFTAADVVTPPADVVTPAVDAPVAMDAGAVGSLVINEISAVGDEWVELYNAGASPVDLSRVQLADTDTSVDGGAPRTASAMRFPAGTMLAPGQYVLVVSGFNDAGAGPQTRCLDGGGPSTCFHASWGLSASRGESVWVLSPTGEVTLRETYPMNAAPSGQTWGRLPNGTGAFAPNRPTPGAANASP